MLKSILSIGKVSILDKETQKAVNGGSTSCNSNCFGKRNGARCYLRAFGSECVGIGSCRNNYCILF